MMVAFTSNSSSIYSTTFLIFHSQFAFFAGNSKQKTRIHTVKASSSIIVDLSAFRLSALTKTIDQTKIKKLKVKYSTVNFQSVFGFDWLRYYLPLAEWIIWCLHLFQMFTISAKKQYTFCSVKGLKCVFFLHWMSSASAKANKERIIIMRPTYWDVT